MPQRFAGDLNEDSDTKFSFWCENENCVIIEEIGKKRFEIIFKEAPEKIPFSAECPYCEKEAEWCLPPLSNTQIRSSDFAERVFKSNESRKSYTKSFQESAIKESKEYLEGQKGISQYAKYDIDYEYFNDQGVMRRVKSNEVRGRQDRANEVAKSVEHLVDIESKVLGRRTDG